MLIFGHGLPFDITGGISFDSFVHGQSVLPTDGNGSFFSKLSLIFIQALKENFQLSTSELLNGLSR